jgi:uncharacterized membrane protein
VTADDDETKSPQTLATIAVVISVTIGIVWNVLAALILFRSYSFFEAVVVSLLVMLLSSVATMRADFSLWEHREEESTEAARLIRDLKSTVQSIFYGIAGLMAVVKMVMALIAA